MNARSFARALGGRVAGIDRILAPGPGHRPADRSLSVKLDPAAKGGFLVHSFAGDDPMACRAHVKAVLGLGDGMENLKATGSSSDNQKHASDDRTALALRLWEEGTDPRGTIVERYLTSRGISLPAAMANNAIRFHPRLGFDGEHFAAMLGLFRDIITDTPCGIHRTFLDPAGRKLGRRMLGRTKGAAIKLAADADVTLGLNIGEGLESCMAGHLAGFTPVWATGSAGAIGSFPVLAAIEAITMLGEVDDGGANHRSAASCAARWTAAGKEAFLVEPLVGGDLNDVWREVVR
jgi:hypothetical protein